jgi:hypothetical protein
VGAFYLLGISWGCTKKLQISLKANLTFKYMTKIDPYKHEERYKKWKEKTGNRIPELSQKNSDLTLRYLSDMEKGLNVANKSVKGGRSFIRLNSIKDKMFFFSRKFEEIYGLEDITKITEEQLIDLFNDMANGNIQKERGGRYNSVETYTKIFKAFWHWYQLVSKKEKGIEVKDITEYLCIKQGKPKWVYLDEEQIKKLINNASFKYRALIMFIYDSGIRSPTELMNIRISDFFNDFKELNIREEVAKTFGRKINLLLCSDLIKEYVKQEGLKGNDQLFDITPFIVNKYLKRLAKKVLGDKESLAGGKYSELTMYDFRHCSCCYWLPRYPTESALLYRFGWKKSDKIHYYSELLGMKDTITQEDLFVGTSKTEIEKELENRKTFGNRNFRTI